MAGGSTNPLRQQMINMMYLVLTALLALNVSSDILKAFALVNGGLEKTNTDYLAKNDLTMNLFKKAYELDKTKAEKVFANAQAANAEADKMYLELQEIKEFLAKGADGWIEGSNKTAVENAQELEIAEHHFVTDNKGANGIALRNRLIEFQNKMKSYVIDEKGNPVPNAVKFDIDTKEEYVDKDKTKKKWHEYYFGGVPVIAAITEITKFQNDVRNAQSEVTNHLYKMIGAEDVKFDNQLAIISSKTPAVFQGGKYEAEIFLGAYSSTQQFDAYVNGQKVPVQNGVAKYSTNASGMGNVPVKVRIDMKDAKGQVKSLTTESEYQVFTGSATIAADKMNMLYIGIENPMSISVPGFSDAQTMVSFSGGAGQRKTGPGKYILKPDGSQRTIKVSVSAKMPDGSTKSMGQQEYRIRKVPNPEVLFGTKNGGPISRGELMTVSMINAGLGEGFAYEGLKYTVTGYTFAYSPKAGGNAYFENVSGNKITGTVRGKLQNARPGDMIVIANVDVMGPTGKKMLNGTNLTVR